MVGLDAGRRLDLDHVQFAAAPGEKIDAHQHAGVPEGRLVEHDVSARRQSRLGVAQRLTEVVLRADQRAAGVEQPLGDVADLVTGGETTLRVGTVDDQLGSMDLEPEPLVALQAGDDA